MGSTDTESASDCLELCKDVAGCEWFTFFERAGECLLTSSCGLVDYSCEGDCVYGKKSCYLADSGNNTEGKKAILFLQETFLKVSKQGLDLSNGTTS